MKHLLSIILVGILAQTVYCQNLFPVKVGNCSTTALCLDCGDTKAGYNEVEFQNMLNSIAKENNINGISGSIYFQVLIDSDGKACVFSHTDKSNNSITKTLIRRLNKFKYWNSAMRDGVAENNTSINLIITINDNKISGVIERFNEEVFKESLRGSRSPEIYNKHYEYKNENLSNYQITRWYRENSELMNDLNDNVAIDTNGNLWFTMDQSLGIMKNESFTRFEQDIDKNGEQGLYYSALAIDNSNTTWVSTSNGIYSFDGSWYFHSSEKIGIDGAYKIINNERTGEVFFCSDEGLTIFADGEWSNINQDSIPELPSNRVYFAKKDSKNRIWIGTFSGSIMIDSNGVVTAFNNEPKTPLYERCVDALTEDENGNLYMGIYQYEPKKPGTINRNEGLVTLSNKGSWNQFTTDNSGIPFNHTTNMAYSEGVLWIATDRAGLVRFDLIDSWENYHSENSDIPTSYVSDIVIKNDGTIYLGTRLGIVKIEKK